VKLFTHALIDGLILSALASSVLIVTLLINPRLFLQDYPADIQEKVPPKTQREKRQSLIAGIPFMLILLALPIWSTVHLKQSGVEAIWSLVLNAFGVAFVFNLFDLLVLDWFMFCTVTPRFLVIPGSEGSPAYKDYGYHFRGALMGTALSAAAGLVIGFFIWLI
jgi:hypothetical protein